jgi:RHS repeat-associated protein
LRYFYEGDTRVAKAGAAGAATHRYIHGPGADSLLVDEVLGAAADNWTLTDHLGSVRQVLSSAAGAPLVNLLEYDEHGVIQRVLNGSGAAIAIEARAVDEAFAGREYVDEVNLYQNRARWYDAGLERFISEDPARADSNLYRYAQNDPLGQVDPSGLAARKPTQLFPGIASGTRGPIRTPTINELTRAVGQYSLTKSLPPIEHSYFKGLESPTLPQPNIDLGRMTVDMMAGKSYGLNTPLPTVAPYSPTAAPPAGPAMSYIRPISQLEANRARMHDLMTGLSTPDQKAEIRRLMISDPDIRPQLWRQAGEGLLYAMAGARRPGPSGLTGVAPLAPRPVYTQVGPSVSAPRSTIRTADEVYTGVREVSQVMKYIGLPRSVRTQVIQSFDVRTIQVRAAGETEFGIRYFDNVDAFPVAVICSKLFLRRVIALVYRLTGIR